MSNAVIRFPQANTVFARKESNIPVIAKIIENKKLNFFRNPILNSLDIVFGDHFRI